jgi:hypothetical protein
MTRRTYTDLQRRPDGGDGDPERAGTDLLARGDGAGTGHVVPGWCDHQPNPGPVLHGGGQPGRRAAGGAEDEHVHPAHALLPEGSEHGAFVGGTVDDEDEGGCSIVGAVGGAAPQVHARGQLLVVCDHGRRRRAGRRHPGPVVGGAGERGEPHRCDGEHGRQGHDPRRRPPGARPPPTFRPVKEQGDGDCHRRDAPKVELGQRQARGRPGHAGDPGQQQPGGQVHEPGDPPSHQAGRQAADQAPHHHRAGGGDGEQVRRHRGQGHPAEHRHQHRRHPDLGGEGHGQGGRHPPALEPGAHDGDPRARAGAQEEADRTAQQRVDQHQHRDGEGEDPDRRRRPADGRRQHRQRSHGHRPQHRWLPSGEHAEHGQDGHAADEAAPQPQASEEGGGDGQDEGDVLPAHGEQVGEAAGAEVIDLGGRLVAVVADDEPGEQGPPLRGHRVGAGDERAADLVGEAGDRRAGAGRGGRRHDQAAADVPAGQVATAGGARRSEAALHVEAVAGQAGGQQRRGVAPDHRRRLDPSPRRRQPELEANPAPLALGVGDDRRVGRHLAAGGRVPDAFPRPGAQAGREQGDGEPQQDRPPDDPRRQPDHEQRPDRHRSGHPRPTQGRQRQHDDREVTHGDPPSSDLDLGSERGELGLADAPDLEELVDGTEAALLLAVGEDRLGGGRADAG